MEENYGYPYFLIHRGDLHKILVDKALDVGARILTSCYVSKVNQEDNSITLEDGKHFKADLIIGADGIQ